MNATIKDPTEDVECSRCHKPTALWDVGLCLPCIQAEQDERLQAQVMNGTLEQNICALQSFVHSLRLTQNFDTKNCASVREYVKQLNVL